MFKNPPPRIIADLDDTPYNYLRRLSPTDIAVTYGYEADAPIERWRLWARPGPVSCRSSYAVRVRGRLYQFAGHIRKDPAAVALGRKGGRVSSRAKADAARANGAKGGRPKTTKPKGPK